MSEQAKSSKTHAQDVDAAPELADESLDDLAGGSTEVIEATFKFYRPNPAGDQTEQFAATAPDGAEIASQPDDSDDLTRKR